MGRVKRGSWWVAGEDEEDEETVDTADLPLSRTAQKAIEDRMEDLANKLSRLPPSMRKKLPLDADHLADLEVLAQAKGKARKRPLARMKHIFRTLEEEEVATLETAAEGEHPAADRLREAERWRKRLVEGDEDDLQAFVEACPRADRQQLRALLAQARGDDTKATRAFRKVFQVVDDALKPG